MEISIESVFLLGCALFVIYYIMRGCGHTIEGYTCGNAPSPQQNARINVKK